jgi:hypothetical protein
MKLLSFEDDHKTIKGNKFGYATAILYLAPANESGVMNTCPNASDGCKKACLFTSGLAGIFSMINNMRKNKTILFKHNRNWFMDTLIGDINDLIKLADKLKMTPCIRLNGTSDIAWESIKHNGKSVMEHFPTIQFYDYTKSPSRMMRFLNGQMPSNYHLTFSKNESNDNECRKVLRNGGNVAVVFKKELPTHYMGKLVVCGDDSDLRFIDPKNVIVGLTAKGKARKDDSGFTVIAKLEKHNLIHTTPVKFTMRKNGIQQLTSV